MPDYLGVDIGTTSIVALVFDTDTFRVRTVAHVDNASETTTPEDQARGSSEWDAERMLELSIQCMAEAANRAGGDGIAGIGVSGQMHGMVLLSDEGRAVSPFINWQDQRCEEREGDEAPTVVDRMLNAAGVGGFAGTGCTPATGYMGSTLYWMSLRNDPRLEQAARASFIADFLVSRLTGEPAATDPTHAGSSGMFDVRRREWKTRLLARLGIDPSLMPPLRPSATTAGTLQKHVADRLRLRVGIPVSVACGDNQASFAGTVSAPDESVLVNVGTGAQISVWSPKYLSVEGVDVRCYLDDGYLLVGAPLCGGASYALVHHFFRQVGQKLFGVETLAGLYEKITQLASEAPPGANGMRCDPLFAGTRQEPERRASWTGVSAANFTPGHFARAVLEGVSQQLRNDYDRMLRSGVAPRAKLIGGGNGVRRNALLRNILASAFDMPLDLSTNTEESAIGAALIAAVACGEFPDLRTAARGFSQER